MRIRFAGTRGGAAGSGEEREHETERWRKDAKGEKGRTDTEGSLPSRWVTAQVQKASLHFTD